MHLHEEDPGRTRAELQQPERTPDQPAKALEAMIAGVPQAAGPPGVMALQRSAGNAGVVQLLEDEVSSPVLDVVGRGGQPLDESVRGPMEQHVGADLGDVRVHTDAKASESAEAVGAQAYTVGNDIAFRSGAYAPGTTEGQRTLAHELTHVVQQRTGPVDGTPQTDGISVSDPSDRFEQAAERSAADFVSAQAAGIGVQRELAGEEPEDGTLQPLLQRQESDELEEEEGPPAG